MRRTAAYREVIVTRASLTSIALASALVLGSTLVVTLDTPAFAGGGGGGLRFGARLTGLQEPPSVLSGARGTFQARRDGDVINYRLTWEGLSSEIVMAHIHIAQKGVNGGIAVWLCDNSTLDPPPPAAPASTPPECMGTSGAVEGSFDADDVLQIAGPPNQALEAMNLAKVLRAIRDGVGYANVHSVNHPPGEIRGQLELGFGGDDDDDEDD
jgi:hypothetical protein